MAYQGFAGYATGPIKKKKKKTDAELLKQARASVRKVQKAKIPLTLGTNPAGLATVKPRPRPAPPGKKPSASPQRPYSDPQSPLRKILAPVAKENAQSRQSDYKAIVRSDPQTRLIDASGKLGWKFNTRAGRALDPKSGAAMKYKGKGDPYNKKNWDMDIRFAAEQQSIQHATAIAPALKILEQTTRPVHAVAAGTKAAIEGKDVLHAASQGIKNKDKTLFSDVLKSLGAPKIVQSVGGFALDMAADPTTYITGGTKHLITAEIKAAAKAATAKAIVEGASKKAAARAGEAAARRLAIEQGAKKGLDLKFAGVPIPGVRKVTGETVGRVGQKVANTKTGQVVREGLSDVNPNIAPRGANQLTYEDSISAARTGRGQESDLVTRARAEVAGIQKALGKDTDRTVAHAIETETIDRLPPNLQKPALAIDAAYKRIDDAEKAVGVERGTIGAKEPRSVPELAQETVGTSRAVARAQKALQVARRGGQGNRVREARAQLAKAQLRHDTKVAAVRQERTSNLAYNKQVANEPKGYVPHYTNRSMQKGKDVEEHTSIGVGRRTITPGSAKARGDDRRGTLMELEQKFPGEYNQNLSLGLLNRMVESAQTVSRAKLNQRIADLGDEFKLGATYDKTTHGIFRQKGTDLQEITGKEELSALRQGKIPDDGRYVVLNRDVVSRAHMVSRPRSTSDKGIMRGFDKVTGGFKFIATQPNPGFHLRNLIGDTHNAYTAQSGFRLPKNMADAGGALRALKRDDEALRTLGKGAKPGRMVNVDGKKMSLADLGREARQAGAIDSGFTAREITDLIHAGESGAKKLDRNIPIASRGLRGLKRMSTSRENLPRLSTYIEGRRLGMNAEEAARFSTMPHFDYANLSEFERRGARRIMPFYTFSARNIPYQAKVLATKPGKIAAYQKVREEAAKASGMDPEYLSDAPEWQQRNVGIPISIGGKKMDLAFGDPISDLNEIPTTLDPTKQFDEWMKKSMSMTNPIIKDPVELFANYSFYFRKDIRPDNAPLVAAPNFVGAFPGWAKKAFSIVQGPDKKTGKTIWKWDAKANYMAHIVPGPINTGLTLASSGTDRAGRQFGDKLIGVGGLKVTPLNEKNRVQNAISNTYGEIDKIQKQIEIRQETMPLGWQKMKKRPADYQLLLDRKRTLLKRVDELNGTGASTKKTINWGNNPIGTTSGTTTGGGKDSTGQKKINWGN